MKILFQAIETCLQRLLVLSVDPSELLHCENVPLPFLYTQKVNKHSTAVAYLWHFSSLCLVHLVQSALALLQQPSVELSDSPATVSALATLPLMLPVAFAQPAS